MLKLEKIKKDSKLFKELEEKGIVLTKKSMPKTVNDLRERYSFLFQGASLHIVVPTLRCNMACVYCHASSKPPNSKGYDMDKETAKKVVDFIFQSPSQVIKIEFQGGEPLLNWKIVEYVIYYANELNKKYNKNLLITIVTNLTLVSDKKLDFLIKNDVSICTSLDGPEKTHNLNRVFIGGEGTYIALVKKIKKVQNEYKKRGIKNRKLNALITLTRQSLKNPKTIIDSYIKNNLMDIHLRFLDNLGCAKETWPKISYSANEFINFWKRAMDYIIEQNKKGKSIRERIATIIVKKIFKKNDPNYLDLRSPCGAAIGQLVYNYNGDIFTCDEGRMIGEDIFKLGNVKKDNYKEILTSNQTWGIISASINDTQICDSCAYKPYCGLCPVCNYAEQGSIIAKIPQTDRCKIFKAQFDYVFDKWLNNSKAKAIFLDWIKK